MFCFVPHFPQPSLKNSPECPLPFWKVKVKHAYLSQYYILYVNSEQIYFIYAPYSGAVGHEIVDVPKGIVTRSFNNADKRRHLKIWLEVCLENDGRRRGLVILNSLLTLKKRLIISNFQSNEPYPKFIRPPIRWKLHIPSGHNLQPLSPGSERLLQFWRPFYMISRPFWTGIRKQRTSHFQLN